MKAHNPGSFGAGSRARSTMRITHVPMEWMDPMSWRLPSGKALAEFALQAGFLAPLMLSGPAAKRKTKPAVQPVVVVEKKAEEAPDQSGTFRETR